jgi:hypothetical protein
MDYTFWVARAESNWTHSSSVPRTSTSSSPTQIDSKERLKKSFGWPSLTSLGIGAVIGWGIFTVVGTAIADQKFESKSNGQREIFAPYCRPDFQKVGGVLADTAKSSPRPTFRKRWGRLVSK